MSSVFVLNCGSSSIKFQIVDPKTAKVFFQGIAENVQTDRCTLSWQIGNKKDKKSLLKSGYHDVIELVVQLLREHEDIEKKIVAIGHRVVHGAEEFIESVIIDEEVLTKIHDCSHLAPLHNPANALGIVVMQELFPKLPQVAVFDTAFHQTLPKYAFLYAIPYQYYEDYEVRRYGFHGTSHRYITQLAAETLGKKQEELSIISAHLGNGCSVCAIQDGKSIDTSMGLTPLEGLMMGQRSGDVDPGVIGYLAEKLQVEAQDVITMLNKMSGLLGVSGVSADLRMVKKAAEEGDGLAVLAIEMFCYRLAKYIASYFVPLGLP
ncbi:MAG: acetate/propionate family kinase, partial [Simkania sp.]|nr:acetate/propionate family kinase [Simkania sp.]